LQLNTFDCAFIFAREDRNSDNSPALFPPELPRSLSEAPADIQDRKTNIPIHKSFGFAHLPLQQIEV
jgi:hypothetical protein